MCQYLIQSGTVRGKISFGKWHNISNKFIRVTAILTRFWEFLIVEHISQSTLSSMHGRRVAEPESLEGMYTGHLSIEELDIRHILPKEVAKIPTTLDFYFDF